jgi:iron-sulfur cluster assembly accessory protein
MEVYDPSTVTSSVELTDSAIQHFINVAEGKLVKFGIIGGGCSGFQYHWETYDELQPHMDGDDVTDYGKFTLYVDNYSLPYLAGTTVDYVNDLTGSRIEIMNPNTTGGCGCGESIQF